MSAAGTAPARTPGAWSAALRWVGAIGVAAIAVMRCVVFFAPQIVFDVDPALDPRPLAGLGPAGSLTLDALLLAAAACGLLGEWLAGRGLDGRMLLLGLLPVPVILGHGFGDAGDLAVGASWAAAMIGAVTMAHLARDRVFRVIIISLLVAVLVPVMVRGAANVTYEHDATVALFEQEKEAILRDRGWAADSPNALIFERRLRQRQPSAWFVTTNIFGSLMAFGVVWFLGTAVASARGRLGGGWCGLSVLMTAAAAAGLWMTGAKGAQASAAAGAGVLVAVLLLPPFGRWRRAGPWVSLLLVTLVPAGVAARGALLPEGFLGEKSLLFRWHYTVSSARILTAHPLVGVGPDGYQDAYVTHRVPRNPEEVASAHSMLWDWSCGLGLVAVAWIALLAWWLWRLGDRWRRSPSLPHDDETATAAMTMTLPAIAVATAGLLVAIAVESRSLDTLGLAVRGLAVLGFVAAAALSAQALRRLDETLVMGALAAAALTVVMHGQIEMTYSQGGSVVWAMAVLGVVAAGERSRPGAAKRDRPSAVWTPVVAAAAIWLVVTGAVPAWRQERRMVAAARLLWPIADARQAMSTMAADHRADTRRLAGEQLAEALEHLGAADLSTFGLPLPDDLLTAPASAAIDGFLRERSRSRRLEAADVLRSAESAMPSSWVPRIAAVRQLARVSELASGPRREELLRQALARLEDGTPRRRPDRATTLACDLHRALAGLTGERRHREAAIAIARALVAADPHGLHPRKRLGDLLWEHGDRAEAVQVYRRTLRISDDFALDPLKQLPAADRRVLEQRIEEGPPGPGAGEHDSGVVFVTPTRAARPA